MKMKELDEGFLLWHGITNPHVLSQRGESRR